nr:protein FAR1-related sequence 5-like [Tanacetum cinerariifolium]
MKHVLTNAKFKEFREELTGKMYCGVGSSKSEGGHIEYEVLEDAMDNESIIKKQFSVWFKKGDSHEECDIRCICHLFEFRGMLCRHALTVVVNHHGQTMKKRSKKEKERNKNDLSLPSHINHSYANFLLHYDGFIPSNAFQQVSPVLQNIAVQM